jgi:hypothetical protein
VTCSCAFALAGCGGGGSKDTGGDTGGGSADGGQPATLSDLCRTPCTDGQGDFADQLTLVKNASNTPGDPAIVSIRVRVKNLGSSSGEVNPDDFELIDSRQETVRADITVRSDSDGGFVPECPNNSSATLVPGDSHTWRVCFGLPDSKDLPKVLVLTDGVELPLR